MKKIILSVFLLIAFSSVYSQRIVNRIFLRSYTKVQLDSILSANGIPAVLGTAYDIDVYRIIYNTVNYDSTAITASGMLAVPHNTTCRFPLAAYEHGTVTAKHDAPSYLNGQEPMIGMVMASVGYIVVEPDYLGLGDGPGIHPYQHAQTEASASIDMLRSAREFCDSAGIRQNGQLFLMGYSEGGHACMATHRAIEQQLQGEMTVTAAVPMSGAYDMSGVMINRMLTDTPYSQPAYLAFLVVSWNPIYHLCDSFSQAFVHPYDSILPLLLDGTHGTNDLNNAMPNIPKRVFTRAELDTFVNNPNSAMRVALRDNDDYDWAPRAPTRIFFCKGDTYVPYQNSCVAINKMRQNGCADCDTMDVNPDLDHVPCAQYSILNAKFFFDRYRRIDCSTGIADIDNAAIVSVYPSPAQDRFTIELYRAGEFASASIYDAMGRLVSTSTLNTGVNTITTDVLTTGVYMIRVTDENGLNKVSRITIQK
ncbi:MAG: T9SS type A sorting domain-containing protein [Bacteroidetes bacterium]|nr:T9SS type A sorting domain-containing protein [Bacteroidota bacterium]